MPHGTSHGSPRFSKRRRRGKFPSTIVLDVFLFYIAASSAPQFSQYHSVGRFIVPQSLHFSVFPASSSPSPSPACRKMGAGAGGAARTELGARGVSVGMTG